MNLNPHEIINKAGNKDNYKNLQSKVNPSIRLETVGGDNQADPLVIYQEWLELLENIFGETGKMDKFKAAGNKIIEDVESRIAKIPESERPSAMILWKYANGVPQVSGQGTFGNSWLKHLGVTDVVASEAKGFAQASMEQIYKWNPDILFVYGPGLLLL